MTGVRTALVIGGGIAGPVAAMALRKAGIEPVVYEAHARSADGVGVFMTLAPNGIDALRTIGADKTVSAAGFPTPGMMMRNAAGKSLGETRTTLPDVTTSRTLKRADLYEIIHDEATSRGIQIEHGKRLVDAHETGEGVRAVFADGSQATGDVLIGADGVHSTVRKLIDPAAPAPTYAGLLSLGGYAHGVAVDAEPGSYTMIFGKRAFFGYAVSPSGEVWWFANVARADEPARGEVEAITGQVWQHRLADLYAQDAGPAVQLVAASRTQDMTATPVHSIPHLPVWHTKRMVVIGDAAHAPTPTSGQGASLSIEDAVELAKCLRDLPRPQQALAQFEALRRPRAERIIKVAGRINSNKTPGPVAQRLLPAILPVVLKMTANSRQTLRMYGHHIEWDDVVTNQG